MAAIRSRNTGPERAVRAALRRLKIRFRAHATWLPGTPDFILPELSIALFVHGCFWHRHRNCRYAYTPKTRTTFWSQKFMANTKRDRRVSRALRSLGWHVWTIWECDEPKGSPQLRRLLTRLTKHS